MTATDLLLLMSAIFIAPVLNGFAGFCLAFFCFVLAILHLSEERKSK